MADKSMTRQHIQEKIVALAWKDEDFRKKFLADPKKQFEDKLGVKMPANLKIAAFQEDENNLHFVIPERPATAGQLSDAQLEKVAGGAGDTYADVGGRIITEFIVKPVEAMGQWGK